MKTRVLLILGCEHVMTGDPLAVYVECGKCGGRHSVTGIHVKEWHAKCRECGFSRWYGLSEALASQMANSHARKKSHDVFVEYRANPVAGRAVRNRKAAGL